MMINFQAAAAFPSSIFTVFWEVKGKVDRWSLVVVGALGNGP